MKRAVVVALAAVTIAVGVARPYELAVAPGSLRQSTRTVKEASVVLSVRLAEIFRLQQ